MLTELKTRARPLQLALLVTTVCGLIEGLLLAQLGEGVLTQFALALPVFLLCDALGYGFGATTAAQACLCDRRHIAPFLRQHLVTLTVIGLGCSLLVVATGWLLARDTALFPYLAVLSGLFPFCFLNHGLWAILRAHNHTQHQAKAMLVHALLIIGCCVVWVAAFAQKDQGGLAGHGLALLVASAAASAYSLSLTLRLLGIRLKESKRRLALQPQTLKLQLAALKFTLHQGGAISLSNIAVPVSVMFINILLNTHAQEALPAYALALRLEAFYLVPFLAFSAMVGPVLLQQQRLLAPVGLGECLVYCLKISIPIALVSVTLPLLLQNALQQCPNTLPGLTTYYYIVPLSYGCYGIVMLSMACFNAMLKPHLSLVLCGVRLLVFLAPLSVLLGVHYSATGIFIAIALSHLFSAVLACFFLRVFFNNFSQPLLTA